MAITTHTTSAKQRPPPSGPTAPPLGSPRTHICASSHVLEGHGLLLEGDPAAGSISALSPPGAKPGLGVSEVPASAGETWRSRGPNPGWPGFPSGADNTLLGGPQQSPPGVQPPPQPFENAQALGPGPPLTRSLNGLRRQPWKVGAPWVRGCQTPSSGPHSRGGSGGRSRLVWGQGLPGRQSATGRLRSQCVTRLPSPGSCPWDSVLVSLHSPFLRDIRRRGGGG